MTDGTDPNGTELNGTEPREPQSNETVASTPDEANGAAADQPTPLTPPTQSSEPASTSTPAPTATVYTSGAAPSAYAATPPQPAAAGYPYIQAPPPKPARERSRSTMPVAATIVVAALVGGVAGAGVVGATWFAAGGAGASTSATTQKVTINDTDSVSRVSAVAAQALPSVVTINVSDGSSGGTGSGVIISADGYIVTNTHVVTMDGSTSAPSIAVVTADGKQYAGTLVGTDPNSDLAVVKIEATGLPAIEFADSDSLNVGETTIAIGAPMELSNTVTQGIISALYRGIEIQSSAAPQDSSSDSGSDGSSPFEFWNFNGQQQGSTGGSAATISLSVIQTDASINPGNSGGALLDANGKLIGLNVAILSDSSSSTGTAGSIGIGFAIPSNQVKRVSSEIIATGTATHGLLGASVTAVDSNAEVRGALVKETTAGGPAASAGITAGDVITQFNGVRVRDQVDLTAMVRAQAAGSDATVTVLRNGTEKTVKVKLGTFGG